MVEEIPYRYFDEIGVEYGVHNKIAIWVHPLWTRVDLGQQLVDKWTNHLHRFEKDDNYVLILTQPDMPRPESDSERNWRARINPIIEELPHRFGDRYLKWPFGNFVIGREESHVQKIKDTFQVVPIHFPDQEVYQNCFFFTAEIDGLYRDMCVDDQKSDLGCLSIRMPTYWN